MLADDRVSGTDADRHEDISLNGSSGFGDSAWTRLFAFAALLVFAAVTLGWWAFLAWLIWLGTTHA
jgi:hypothetical protein